MHPAVRALIRDNKSHQISSIIQTGGQYGMRTMNQALNELYRMRHITYEEAISRSTDTIRFDRSALEPEYYEENTNGNNPININCIIRILCSGRGHL